MAELFEMPKSETQLAEECMAAVERQVHKKLPAGATRAILCPYCGTWNFPHRSFCCETLRYAIVTICVADRALKAAEATERAMVN